MLNKYLLYVCVSCADCYPGPCPGAGEDPDPHRGAARHHGPRQALRHHQLNVSLYLYISVLFVTIVSLSLEPL